MTRTDAAAMTRATARYRGSWLAAGCRAEARALIALLG
jgi:hypothetical protein